MDPTGDITRLISEWQRGDKAAENALFEALYNRLHAKALQVLRSEPRGQSMGPTALVHEAYLKLEQSERLEVTDRKHFVRLVAKVMRDILVDRARARLSSKRGGDLVRVEESDQLVRTDADADEILAVDLALGTLKRQSPRQAQLVVLRYYGGFTMEESAAVMGVSERTAKRDWEQARVRLRAAIEGAGGSTPLQAT
ncbi:MAG TPA: ECF-type sigma factor [Bryobacteraceae bacterium]|nr:ECF-type sigma factor [Bryobacteraceae bacterium]